MKTEPIIQILRLHPERDRDVPLPRYMSGQAAGMDICAAVPSDVIIGKGEIRLLPTGFAIALPPGFEAEIRPRSGLAINHGIGLINSPGTVDADYRGEIKIAVVNWGPDSYRIRRGDRIAQMIIHRVCRAGWNEVESLDPTVRGAGGFGHTGK